VDQRKIKEFEDKEKETTRTIADLKAENAKLTSNAQTATAATTQTETNLRSEIAKLNSEMATLRGYFATLRTKLGLGPRKDSIEDASDIIDMIVKISELFKFGEIEKRPNLSNMDKPRQTRTGSKTQSVTDNSLYARIRDIMDDIGDIFTSDAKEKIVRGAELATLQSQITPLVKKRADIGSLLQQMFGDDWKEKPFDQFFLNSQTWIEFKNYSGKGTSLEALKYAKGISEVVYDANGKKAIDINDLRSGMSDVNRLFSMSESNDLKNAFSNLHNAFEKLAVTSYLAQDRGALLKMLNEMPKFLSLMHAERLIFSDVAETVERMKLMLLEMYKYVAERNGEKPAEDPKIATILNYVKGHDFTALVNVGKSTSGNVPGFSYFQNAEERSKLVEIETAFFAYQNAFRQMTNRLSGVAITRASAADFD
jgi:hypothetical protein